MATISFSTSSTHKFTDPVRYFKSNDPYYWEVDNIPLKQLQENCLWLKDNIEGANVEITVPGVSRLNFDELRPYFKGGDRTARVLPGRYMSRVNSVFGTASTGAHDKLAELVWENTSPSWESYLINPFDAHPSIHESKLQELALQSASFDLNGLETLMLGTWMHMDGTEFVTPSVGKHDYINKDNQPYNIHPQDVSQHNAWPQAGSVGFWKNFNEDAKASFFSWPRYLQDLSINLCRQWRGVARTAVVDVPEELTIDVTPFDKNDYFYMQGLDDEGPVVLLDPPSYRMDLLFIYSKTVDQTQTFINKFEGGPSGNEGGPETCGECSNPTKLTKATLGIVKGAGLGMNYDRAVNGAKKFVTLGVNPDLFPGDPPSKFTNDVQQDSDGNWIMLGNKADEDNTSNGFKLGPYTKIEAHGSFPSPEDLLNLSPNLQEEQEKNSWELVGQTILPVAYIMVPNPDKVSGLTTNETSQTNLTNHYLLDIRPFFRTAELAFNERSGIAAAIPQLSYANPAVGELQLRAAQKEVVDFLGGGGGGGTSQSTNSEIIADGVVWGGLLYGPEGVLFGNTQDASFGSQPELTQDGVKGANTDISQIYTGGNIGNTGNVDTQSGKSNWYKKVFGGEYKSGIEVPFFPAWDVGGEVATKSDAYEKPNDWLQGPFQIAGGNPGKYGQPDQSCLGPLGMYKNTRQTLDLKGGQTGFGYYDNDNKAQGGSSSHGHRTAVGHVKKRIIIDAIPDWVQDLSVHATFKNCSPMVRADHHDHLGNMVQGINCENQTGIFDVATELGPNAFWANGLWSGAQALTGRAAVITVTVYLQNMENLYPVNYRTDHRFHNFVAHQPYLDAFGPCVYPSVQWTVVGHSEAGRTPAKTFYGIPEDNTDKTKIGLDNFTSQISNISGSAQGAANLAINTGLAHARFKCS